MRPRTRRRLTAREMSRRARLFRFGSRLNRCAPEAEKWFKRRWMELGMCASLDSRSPSEDRFNFPVGPYIPDVVNVGYRYCIEVDEPHHDRFDVAQRDAYRQRQIEGVYSLKVWRVTAYDEEGLLKLAEAVRERRSRPCPDGSAFSVGHLNLRKAKKCKKRAAAVEEILNGPREKPKAAAPVVIIRRRSGGSSS